MKKFLVIFLIAHIFSYANYLISNSEIVLFYDKNYNSVHYIRGDIFNGIDISRIEGKLIIDEKKVIAINKYFEKAELLPQTNILKLYYSIEGKELVIDIIPSMLEKDKLYFIVEFINFLPDGKKVDFTFKIAPQYDNKYLDYNEKKASYSYDNFYFKSINYEGEVYIGRDSVIEELALEKFKGKTKKYQDDNMYYVMENIDYTKPIEFVIKFYRDFNEKPIIEEKNVLSRELEYWEKINGNKKYLDKRSIFLSQLRNLEIMTSRVVIPDKISYDKSEENLNNKVKLYYLSSIYENGFDTNRFFEDINIRKTDNQAVIYYTFLFKYLNRSGDYVGEYLLNNKIIPEVLSLLDYVEEIDGEIINVRDNIADYYWYLELINNIVNRPEFNQEKEFILEKKAILLNYINKNYVMEDGLKIRKTSHESYYKNIKYMSFLPKEKQKEILNTDYKKYYNRLYGLLKEKSEEKIDLEYNLNFIIKLYENGEVKLADILFANLDSYIRKNEGYINLSIYPDRDNPAGIYGELVYLYFTAMECKERYGY